MNPFIGEIIMFAGNFAPRGWAFCHGQLLPIAQNTALFSILGTTYGGDGRTTFGLPDIQGRKVISRGNGPGLPNYILGQKTGNPTTVLSIPNLPATNVNYFAASVDATETDPSSGVLATPADETAIYSSKTPNAILAPASIKGAQNTDFSNEGPYLGMNYIVALVGTYPSRS